MSLHSFIVLKKLSILKIFNFIIIIHPPFKKLSDDNLMCYIFRFTHHPYKYIVTKTFLNEYLISALIYHYSAIFAGILPGNIQNAHGKLFRNNCCFPVRRHDRQMKLPLCFLLTYCMPFEDGNFL